MQQPNSMPASPSGYSPPGYSPPQTPGSQPITLERPQTVSYALCDSPTGLLAHVYDLINPSSRGGNSPTNAKGASGSEDPWTPDALIDWCMLYWLPGPEVALRWLMNSAPMIPKLWRSHSHVPLAISHFADQTGSPAGTQWAESYHQIAMIRRRSGSVRFAAWERPAEMVADIRELAGFIAPIFFGNFSPSPGGSMGPPPPIVPSNMGPPAMPMGRGGY